MSFITGGVRRTDDGSRIFTKTSLKLMVKDDPYSVTFYSTSTLGAQFEGTLNRAPAEHTLIVTGPDPHTDRRWHAEVRYNKQKDLVKVT